MPIIFDPTFTPPPAPTVVTSPDGILTARVEAEHAGVLLTADYSADPTVARVRFHRADATTVRSGDTAWAPGGWATAYDHEVPLGGVGASWYVVPIGFDGTEGPASQLVAVSVPAPVSGVWVKSLESPELSMLVDVLAEGSQSPFSRAARNEFSRVPGARFPVASWDRRGGVDLTVRLRTSTVAEADALDALLDSGPLLLQPAAKYGIADLYALPGDAGWEYLNDARGASSRGWPLTFAEIGRPAPLGAPLMIPGRSYDQVEAGYASYDDLAAQVDTYNALLGVV